MGFGFCWIQSLSLVKLLAIIHKVDFDEGQFIDLHEFVELNTKGIDFDEILANLREEFDFALVETEYFVPFLCFLVIQLMMLRCSMKCLRETSVQIRFWVEVTLNSFFLVVVLRCLCLNLVVVLYPHPPFCFIAV